MYELLTRASQGSTLGPVVLIIYLNNDTDVISIVKIIKHAANNEIYDAHRGVEVIKSKLTKERG